MRPLSWEATVQAFEPALGPDRQVGRVLQQHDTRAVVGHELTQGIQQRLQRGVQVEGTSQRRGGVPQGFGQNTLLPLRPLSLLTAR